MRLMAYGGGGGVVSLVWHTVGVAGLRGVKAWVNALISCTAAVCEAFHSKLQQIIHIITL